MNYRVKWSQNPVSEGDDSVYIWKSSYVIFKLVFPATGSVLTADFLSFSSKNVVFINIFIR